MSYGETIAYLFGLQQYGMKFGLDNIIRLLSDLGNPQNSFRSVHVAGTNGKGSTSAMIESILRTSGAVTGLFTSPHLISYTERIRICGREIPESEVVRLAEEVRLTAKKIPDFLPTFFEVTTAMAFLHFRQMKVAWAVIETGMGGRLDATNAVIPEASVITPIGMDHRGFLGNSIREIAREKAGIIKHGVPVISAAQHPDAEEILRLRAVESGSPLYTCGKDFSVDLISDELKGIRINYRGKVQHDDLKLYLAGSHQAINAAVALRTVEELKGQEPGLHCDVRKGLVETTWPGRLELVKDEPPILIDGAHNPPAASVLAEYLGRARSHYRRIILILGIMGDKDREGIMEPLLPLASELIFTAAAYGRSASPESLASEAGRLGYSGRTAQTVSNALQMAEGFYRPGDLIVVTGSFYTIGEAKEALGHKGVLARLRE